MSALAVLAWLRRTVCALALPLALAGCGGGGSSDGTPDPSPDVDGTTYAISGTIDGLQAGPMELKLVVIVRLGDGTDDVREEIISVGNGPYAFTLRAPASAQALLFPSAGLLAPKQACRATPRGEGAATDWQSQAIQGDQVVAFRCGPVHFLRGTATGTAPLGFKMLELLIDGQLATAPAGVTVPGPFVFPNYGPDTPVSLGGIMAGENYLLRPVDDGKRCRVLNGAGVMPARDVEDVVVECGLQTVRYQVIGLVGSGLQVSLTATIPGQPAALQETRTHAADGTFEFEAELNEGDTYAVTVTVAPTGPKQECSVEKGEGVVADADVTDVVVRCPGLLREWRFYGPNASQDRLGRSTSGVVYDTYLYPEPTIGNTVPSVPLDLQHLDLDIYKNLFDLPGAQMGVYSNETGKTFWVAAETPSANLSARLTRLTTYWWMRKTKDIATVKFQITDVWLDAFVDGAGGLFGHEPVYLESLAGMGLMAARIPAGATLPLSPFYWAEDVARLEATLNPANGIEWDFKVMGQVDGPWVPLFDESMFDVQKFRHDLFGTVGAARVSLNKEIDLVIDLSQVGPNDRVMLTMQAFAMVKNAISRESLATAYFRDPAEFDTTAPQGGITITSMDGLELVEPGVLPADYQPTPDTTPAAACADPASERALVQFGAGAFAIAENDSLNRIVTITRTGSTVGEVTARLLLAPGTAAEGADFTRREFFVRFAKGSASPRSVTVPLIDDTLQEIPETMQLSLVDVSGCADLGPQSSVTLIIQDDDTPPATIPTFTLGGSVSGLVGSGLVIGNIATDPLPIAADGAFQFPRLFAAGHIYRIQVTNQPQNPRQSCTVANGEGTITNASIDNVQISCTTLAEPGGLDPSFGTGGLAWTSLLGVVPQNTELAHQADGKLLVVGGNAGLLRLLPDGTPDPSFGAAGNGLATLAGGRNDRFSLQALAVQPDGRIVVAGNVTIGVSGRADMLVARYLANGTLDASFGGGTGMASFDYAQWNDGASHVLLQPDGSILLVGTVSDVSGNGDPSDFAVLRLTAGGQVDTTYGSNGWSRANVGGGYDVPRAAVLTPDGGVVLAGRVAPSGGSNGDVGLVKFTAAGVPDTAFGTGGTGTVRRITPEHDEARDIVAMPDGRLLVVGERGATNTGGPYVLWLARYLANGQLDTTFGSGGIATLATPLSGYAVAVQADGAVWVAGGTPAANGSSADYGLARFTATGQPDGSFGSGGLLAVDLFGGFDTPGAMLLQPDGRVVVAGSANNGSTLGLGLVRVVP